MPTPAITDYYNLSAIEINRLEKNIFRLEKVRSQQIIMRYLKPDMRIADIGGAAGAYSFWLQDLGHEVHLLDAVDLHIQIAQNTSKEINRPLGSIQLGDARKLPFPEEQFDMVLLMGPLYHLQEKKDRLKAISEAKRILKPGGVLIAATIGRHASLLDGFWHGFINDPVFEKIVRQDQQDGNHYAENLPMYFTDAHFHTQKEIEEEFASSAFADFSIKAVEGFGWLIPLFDDKWDQEESRQKLLEYIELTEDDSSMIGISAHVLTIALK